MPRPIVLTTLVPLLLLSPGPATAQEATPDRAWHWTMAAWSPERQQSPFELHYAFVGYRAIGEPEARWSRGSEIGIGTRATSRVLPFLITWTSDPTLRILDSKSFALSIVQTVRVALSLGPLEPEVGGGFSTLTIDAFHGDFSAGMLSPRAEAGLWLHVGGLRLGVEAYGEYLWRWFGNADYLLRGVAFEVALGGQPAPAQAPPSRAVRNESVTRAGGGEGGAPANRARRSMAKARRLDEALTETPAAP